MLRVRCAWENKPQGLAKSPITELTKLIVDGAEVSPQLVAKKAPRGAFHTDYFHQFHLTNPAPGRHIAEALVRVLETKAEVKRRIEFTVT